MDIDKNKHSMVISVKPVLLYNSLFLEKNKQDIYAFEMDDASNPGAITGYCYKNNSNCKELFNKLRENSKCIVSLDAWYPDKVFNEDRLLGVHAEIGNIKIQKCTNGYF